MDPVRDVKVTPSSATNIRHFEAKNMCEDDDRQRPAPSNTSLEIDVELLSTDAPAPTLVLGPSGTSVPPSSSHDPGDSSSN